jgi:hypothetical protein
MAITVANVGTLTLTTGEQTLGSARTDGKTYCLQLDLNTMANGDVLEITVYAKTNTASGTARLMDKLYFSDAQGDPVWQSVPYAAPYSLEFKAKQPTGTLRTIEYALFSID